MQKARLLLRLTRARNDGISKDRNPGKESRLSDSIKFGVSRVFNGSFMHNRSFSNLLFSQLIYSFYF